MMCTKCRATARNKLIKLQFDCAGTGPVTGTHDLDNLERYARGRAPRRYHGWPFNFPNLSGQEIMNHIPNRVNMVPLLCLPATPNYESPVPSDNDSGEPSSG